MDKVLTDVQDLLREILIGEAKLNTIEFKADVLDIYLRLRDEEIKARFLFLCGDQNILKLEIPNSPNVLWISRGYLNAIKTIFFVDNMKIQAIKALREHSCLNGLSNDRPGLGECKAFVESMTPNM